MALTEDEMARARYHTGYGGVNESSTFVLGVPAGVQTQFVIEAAFKRLRASAEPRFRRLLDALDALDEQVIANADTLVASAVGDITLRPDEMPQIVKRYLWFVNSLCNILMVPRNPFDQRFASYSGGGSINVSVRG